MLDFIMVPTVIGIITLGIYKLFELFVCRRERMTIIEKLGDKISATNLSGKFSLPDYSRSRVSSSALKGGCLMLGIGLGLLIGFFICANQVPGYVTMANMDWNVRQMISVIYGANVLLFGGIGLIVAFLIENKMGKKNKD